MSKTLTHAKILVDPTAYKAFVNLAREKGLKIQAYLGLLIEREVNASAGNEDQSMTAGMPSCRGCGK